MGRKKAEQWPPHKPFCNDNYLRCAVGETSPRYKPQLYNHVIIKLLKRYLKKVVTGILTICFIFLIITGTIVHEELIPENAKIIVIPDSKFWFPDSEPARESLRRLSSLYKESNTVHVQSLLESIAYEMMSEGQIRSTYAETKKGGSYEGYETLPEWEKGEYSVKNGYSSSLLWMWITGKSRWNDDGSWNY